MSIEKPREFARTLNARHASSVLMAAAGVQPREVVRQVLTYNAKSIIVAHNHPSGCCQPSMLDQDLTERLRQSLCLIGVRLVDHYVVGDRQSFSEHGLL
jgi:DNA repair protein RadC